TGDVVYVGGTFYGEYGKALRRNLAAFDAGSGLATPWNPSIDGDVLALAASATTLYVGGRFTHIGGVARAGLAALDPTTGTALGWMPEPDQVVTGLVLDGPTLYALGSFSHIGGQARTRAAALDVATGLATPWVPRELTGGVDQLAVGDGAGYMTGSGGARGGSVLRTGVAAACAA